MTSPVKIINAKCPPIIFPANLKVRVSGLSNMPKISIGTTIKYKGQANPGGAKFFQCPIGPYFLIPAIVKAKNVIVANAKFKLILAVTVFPPLVRGYKNVL